jgi:hypothetical protein
MASCMIFILRILAVVKSSRFQRENTCHRLGVGELCVSARVSKSPTGTASSQERPSNSSSRPPFRIQLRPCLTLYSSYPVPHACTPPSVTASSRFARVSPALRHSRRLPRRASPARPAPDTSRDSRGHGFLPGFFRSLGSLIVSCAVPSVNCPDCATSRASRADRERSLGTYRASRFTVQQRFRKRRRI